MMSVSTVIETSWALATGFQAMIPPTPTRAASTRRGNHGQPGARSAIAPSTSRIGWRRTWATRMNTQMMRSTMPTALMRIPRSWDGSSQLSATDTREKKIDTDTARRGVRP